MGCRRIGPAGKLRILLGDTHTLSAERLMIEPLPPSLDRHQWSHTSIRFVTSLQAGDDTAWRRVLTKTLWQVYAMGC
jgi:hypothetical protein